MKTLARESYDRAARFLRDYARPLEAALFAFRFEDGNPADVRRALTSFRNEDGGFGRGLEPDVRTSASSPYLTGLALDTLREIDTGRDDPLVTGAVDYLVSTLDTRAGVWPALPREAQEAPHAPWWSDGGPPPFTSLAETFDGFRIIPRARIVDGLAWFEATGSRSQFAGVIDDTLATIAAATPALLSSGTAFPDAARLASNEAIPEADRKPALDTLRRLLPEVVEGDPAAWSSYCPSPVSILPEPSDLAKNDSGQLDMAQLTAAHLDYLIDSQAPDGSWYPRWDWGGSYPDAFQAARREWQGVVTLETLTSLAAYGRVAG
jgi:hypothetical protein